MNPSDSDQILLSDFQTLAWALRFAQQEGLKEIRLRDVLLGTIATYSEIVQRMGRPVDESMQLSGESARWILQRFGFSVDSTEKTGSAHRLRPVPRQDMPLAREATAVLEILRQRNEAISLSALLAEVVSTIKPPLDAKESALPVAERLELVLQRLP